jgi:hypothetical protein
VRCPAHGGVQHGPNDAIIAMRRVETRLLERLVPHRVGRVIRALGGNSVKHTYSDGDTHRKDRVSRLDQRNQQEVITWQYTFYQDGKERVSYCLAAPKPA